MLIHTVFFWLQPDLSDDSRQQFIKYLESFSQIAVVQKVYIGTPAKVATRPVVDQSFSFSLLIHFADVAAHDRYQVDPLHQKFVEHCRPMWTRVQIHDSEI